MSVEYFIQTASHIFSMTSVSTAILFIMKNISEMMSFDIHLSNLCVFNIEITCLYWVYTLYINDTHLLYRNHFMPFYIISVRFIVIIFNMDDNAPIVIMK